jgi:hypothetical protein
MKTSKTRWAILAASLMISAAGLWAATTDAIADSTPPAAPASPTAPMRAYQRRLSMDYLRWQAADPQEQAIQSQREAEEWTKLVGFIKENSPNRYLLLLRQTPAPLPGSMVRFRLLQRWLNLEQLQRNQPDLYAIRVDQFKAEDAMIGLVAEFRQARRHTDFGRVRDLKARIRAQAAKLVDLNLRDRQLRLKNIQAALSQQESQLAQDMLNRDKLVDERANQILSRTDRLSGFRDRTPASQPAR